jgi:hypothetical protein
MDLQLFGRLAQTETTLSKLRSSATVMARPRPDAAEAAEYIFELLTQFRLIAAEHQQLAFLGYLLSCAAEEARMRSEQPQDLGARSIRHDAGVAGAHGYRDPLSNRHQRQRRAF